MSTETLITILEEIRDQQKQQISNFERALQAQDEAIALQRRGRRMLVFLIFTPWVLVVVLLAVVLLRPLAGM